MNLYSPERTLSYDLLDNSIVTDLTLNPGKLYREIKASNPKIDTVIIDEIQKIPQLLDEVQICMRDFPHIQFVLCGSSTRKLKRMHANLLGGRASTCHLGPLTLNELGSRFDLTKALDVGTIPKIYLSERKDAVAILRGYVDTYLQEEIRQEALVRNLGIFGSFLTLAGRESGSILNYSGLAGDLSIDYKTVQGYFEILNDTLLIRILPAFRSSLRKKLAKHPKYYFFDTGVLRTLRKELTLVVQSGQTSYGNLFEHFVVNELMMMNEYGKKDLIFSFYREHSGVEVDLIIEHPNGMMTAVEIKGKSRISQDDLKGLKAFHDSFPKARLFLIKPDGRRESFGDVTVLPCTQMREVLEEG